MSFQPEINQLIEIEKIAYRIAEHPFAPGIPYGQEGRQATVYQLVAPDGDKRALRVFKPRFRVPAMVALTAQMVKYADLPGLEVCRRQILTQQRNSKLLEQNPELQFAVLMPWIEGPTWTEILLEKWELSSEWSLYLARALAEILSEMGNRSIAHCDLSGPNMLIPALAQSGSTIQNPESSIALVDVEGMYSPSLPRPDALPAGSPGYAHRSASSGLYTSNADRFAGAVLMAEMLTWCEPHLRQAAFGESYFDPNEMQQDTERYRNCMHVLRERWGRDVADLFANVWQSKTLEDCPPFSKWQMTLERIQAPEATTIPSAQAMLTDSLIAQARRMEEEGNWQRAIETYRVALGRLPANNPLRQELELIVANLAHREQTEGHVENVLRQADEFAKQGRWQEAARGYQWAINLAPNSPTVEKWRLRAKQCQEEADFARLFEQGASALRSQEWNAARELLTELLRR